MEIFISYRRSDSKTITGRIYDRLAVAFEAGRVFKDVDSIQPGSDYRLVLKEAVARCNVLIAVIGPGWLGATDGKGQRRLDLPDDFVRVEIESALGRGVRVIPVLVEDATMPGSEDLPPSLSDLPYFHALKVGHDPYFHPDVDRLIKALNQLGLEDQARAEKEREEMAALSAQRAIQMKELLKICEDTSAQITEILQNGTYDRSGENEDVMEGYRKLLNKFKDPAQK